MKIGKRLISLLLLLAMLLTCLPFVSGAEPGEEKSGESWSTYFDETLQMGNFVYFGSFEGTELVWYVCETDGDEALLYCVTPFLKGEYDASINFYQYTAPGWQVRYGSSSWRTSDVRYFLNSGAEDLEYTDVCFDYSGLSGGTGGSYDSATQNTPPSYAQYDGFLNKDNFMEEEAALLNPTVQNTLVSFIDPAHCGKGTPDLKDYGYYGAENAHTLVDAGFSHIVTEDYMFLFSSEQYYKYETELQWTDYRMDEQWTGGAYWLRDAPKYYTKGWLEYLWVGMYQNFAGASNSYYHGHNDAMESSAYKYAHDSIQIRPACYIATDYIEELSGEGSYADPYRMTIDPSVVDRPEYTEGDIYRQHPQNLTLTVYTTIHGPEGSQDVYRLCEGAKVIVNDIPYKTDSNGQVTIPYPRSGAEIKYDGYSTRKLSGPQLEGTPEVYLQKKSDEPVLNGVWVDNVDVLHKEYTLDLMKSGSHYVRVEVDWGDSDCDTLILRQGAEIVDLAPSGARITWSDHFDISDTIELVAIDTDGDTRRAPLKLKVDTVLPSQLNGFKVSFGDGFTITLGDSAGPFLSGTEVQTGIYSPVKFECSIEDGKAYLVFGVQGDFSTDHSGKLKPKETVFGLKKLTESLTKNTGDFAKQYRELQNFMQQNDMGIGRGKGSFTVSCNFDLLGFMEGYVNSKGEIIWLDSGFILGGGGGFEYGCPMTVGAVPLFFEVGWKNELMLQGHFRSDPQKQIFSPNAELRWTSTVHGGLGVGIKDTLSISGGLEGKLLAKWEINLDKTDYFELRATLGAYFKGNLAIFEVKPEIPPAINKLIVEYPSSRAAIIHGQGTQAETLRFDLYAPDAYTLQPVTQTRWQCGHGLKNGSITLISGLSDSADPQLLRLPDGKLALLYVGQNPVYPDANGQQLYVTVYDGSTWSVPVLFLDNGSADAYAYVDRENQKLIWTEFDTLSQDSTLEDASTRIMAGDISSDGTFSGLPLGVSGFEALGYQPVIVETKGSSPMGGGYTAIWQGNANGDWFSPLGNIIYTNSTALGGLWGSARATYTDLGMITSLTADSVDGAPRIAWAMDTDGDIYSSQDVEIFVDGVQLTDNEVAESNLAYSQGVLYWYADGKIYADGQVILESGEIALSPVFQIVEDRGIKVILFTAENGLYTTLFASWCLDGSWSAPVALTEGTEYIYDYSAAVDKDGKLTVALCSKEVDPENADAPYGEGSLCVFTVENGIDLQLLYADTDASRYVSGKDQVFDLSVTNRGNAAAAGLLVEILDQTTGLTVEHLEQIPLAPGETHTFSCSMGIASANQVRELTIRVTPLEAEDLRPGNNETALTLRWDDLAVEQISWGYRADEKAVVYAAIVNRSYNPCQNILVSLRRDSADGEVLQTTTIDNLQKLGLQGVSFAVDAELDAVYYITVEAEDDNNGNNAGFVLLNSRTGATVDGSDDPYEPEEPIDPNLPCDGGSSCPGRGFTDMPPAGVWSHAGIDYAISHGLMNGMSNTTFEPDGTMTRAMLVTVLWRYAGQPAEGTNSFTDVPSNVWYTQAVAWAAENGIVTGIGGGRFDPDGQITREQLAVILYRYCKSIGIDTSPSAELS
ncbi:MAG: S-layer homology domain-containing protein, partial [Oscillospiraceae bacterium]|nr:S-layer homology domain-containing protein [Oscillospiraceae bacterium]